MSRSHFSNSLPILEGRYQELDQKLSFFDSAFGTTEARCIGSLNKSGERCSNHLNKVQHSDTLKDMVRAGDDPRLLTEHLRGMVGPLASRMSCHLHCRQEGVWEAVYFALIGYRNFFPPAEFHSDYPYANAQVDEMDWERT
jgi:hypothetical protein